MRIKPGLLIILACSSIFLFFFSSCLKNNEEPVTVYSMNDYVGQWKGTFPATSIDDPSTSEMKMSLIPYANNTVLAGYLKTPDGILILDNAMFFGGIFSFTIRNSHFYDPGCQAWNASGSAYLMHINNIGLSYGGTFCDAKPVDVNGTMTRSSTYSDSTVFLTMAAPGHMLTYQQQMSDTTLFEFYMEFLKDLGNGVWRMKSGFGGMAVTTYLYVTPVEWGYLPTQDSLPGNKITAYRIDAKNGIRYVTVVSPGDTIISTIASLGENVTVPAGTFRCIKIVQEYKLLAGGGTDDTREIWLSNNFGIVKMQRYQNDSLVTTQVLKEKNF